MTDCYSPAAVTAGRLSSQQPPEAIDYDAQRSHHGQSQPGSTPGPSPPYLFTATDSRRRNGPPRVSDGGRPRLRANIQYGQASVGSSLGNSLQIPLSSYPGRGATSLPVTLYYSSNVWRIRYKNTIFNPYNTSLSEPVAEAKYAEHSVAGWTSSLGVPVLDWPDAQRGLRLRRKACLSGLPQPCLLSRQLLESPAANRAHARRLDARVAA